MSSGPPIGVHDAASRRKGRTPLEMVAVLLLGIATVATAWCGFQSSQWNGRETEESRTAALDRIEASRLYNVAAQKVAYDANVTGQYAAALAAGDERLISFIRDNLVRKDFLPYLTAWETAIRAGDAQAESPFDSKAYIDDQFGDSTKVTAQSDAALDRSDEASKNGDDYLLATLLTATALFFAGVTTSFSSRPARLALAALAAASLAAVAMRLASLPIA